jgi:hypothetical protein
MGPDGSTPAAKLQRQRESVVTTTREGVSRGALVALSWLCAAAHEAREDRRAVPWP